MKKLANSQLEVGKLFSSMRIDHFLATEWVRLKDSHIGVLGIQILNEIEKEYQCQGGSSTSRWWRHKQQTELANPFQNVFKPFPVQTTHSLSRKLPT